MGLSLLVRVALPWGSVFRDGRTVFQGNDCWYHMRLVENLVHHFPHCILDDPYAFQPGGQAVTAGHLMDQLIGLFVLILGMGRFSEALIDQVGAVTPAVMGAVVTIPVFFIGRVMFGRRAALFASALIAFLPGKFLWFSRLGAVDHHVGEILFSTAAMLALILALRHGARAAPAGRPTGPWGGSSPARSLAWAVFGGVALGCYLLTWAGGALLVFMLSVYAVAYAVLAHGMGRPAHAVFAVMGAAFLIALAMVAAWLPPLATKHYHVLALAAGLGACVGLGLVSYAATRQAWRRPVFPLAVLVSAGLAAGVMNLVDPGLLGGLLRAFRVFAPSGAALTVAEVRPFFHATGSFSLMPLLTEFTTTAILAPAAFFVVAARAYRTCDAARSLIVVWSLAAFLATLGQNRFAAYLAVPAALLGGFACAGLHEDLLRRVAESRARAEARRSASVPRPADRLSRLLHRPAVALLAVLVFAIAPNVKLSFQVASRDTGPDRAWLDALSWLRANTPEPFGDASYYYEDYPRGGMTGGARASAYGVMCWWDYGYWVVTLAHRPPNANPTQRGASEAARFFTAQDETQAGGVVDRLESRYVVVDGELPLGLERAETKPRGKFNAMARWVGEDPARFAETWFRVAENGDLEPVIVYHPAYYRSLCARLFLFDGRAVAPHRATWVVSCEDRAGEGKTTIKVIKAMRRFDTYDEAEAFLETEADTGARLVGLDPLKSCVPLGGLSRFTLIHTSKPSRSALAEVRGSVKIFQLSRSPAASRRLAPPAGAEGRPGSPNRRGLDCRVPFWVFMGYNGSEVPGGGSVAGRPAAASDKHDNGAFQDSGTRWSERTISSSTYVRALSISSRASRRRGSSSM